MCNRHRRSSTPPSAAPRQAASLGFTMIELMVAVAIVSVLASIAYPAYTDFSRRGQLPEAFGQLADYRVKMEQYYQDNRSYGNGTDCAGGSTGPTWATFASTTYFRYSCVLTDSGQGYVITATGFTGGVSGHTYTVSNANQRTTTQFKGATVSGKLCWLVKGTEC